MSEKIPYEQVMGRMRMDIDYIAEEAYQKGFEAGQHEATTLEYEQGLNDAWETITTIAKMPDGERGKVFGETWISNILNGNSLGEITEKLKAYEKQKTNAEIMAGDEVIYNNTMVCIVLTPETDKKYASIFDCYGNHYSADHRELKKTGKHYDHIEQLLAEMREHQKSCSNCKHEFKLRCEWPCEDCVCHDRWEQKEGAECTD